jgi:mycoredoxin
MNTSEEVVIVYGTQWCPDCNRAKKVFARMNCPYTYIDIDQDQVARELVQKINNGFCSVPTIVFTDGSSLTEPDNYTLEQKLIQLGY